MSVYWDLKHRLGEAVNAHDLGGVLDCYSADAVYVTPSGVAEGHEQIAWYYEHLFKGFPDFQLTPWFEVGDCENPAVTEWTMTGTHSGPFLLPDGHELEATGRHITVRSTCSTFVEDGKIKTHRDYFDQLELYSQLGFGLRELEPAATSPPDGTRTCAAPASPASPASPAGGDTRSSAERPTGLRRLLSWPGRSAGERRDRGVR